MSADKELERLNADVRQDEDLYKKVISRMKELAPDMGSEAEAMVKAAEESGYHISVGALERAEAAGQEMSDDALDQVAGGGWCMSDYDCAAIEYQDDQDEYGHNAKCVTAWHCWAVTLHTETDSEEVSCWADYSCIEIFGCRNSTKEPFQEW